MGHAGGPAAAPGDAGGAGHPSGGAGVRAGAREGRVRVRARVCKARGPSAAGARRAGGRRTGWVLGRLGAAGVGGRGGGRSGLSGRWGWDLPGSQGQGADPVSRGARGPAGTRAVARNSAAARFLGLDPRAITQPRDSPTWRGRGRGGGAGCAPKSKCCAGEGESPPWTPRCLGLGPLVVL